MSGSLDPARRGESSESSAARECSGSLPLPLAAANDDAAAARIDRFAAVIVPLVAAAVSCFWSGGGDLGFHLATGREVLATGKIPTLNLLSFGEPEHAWGLHQWLPAVWFELLY